MVKSSGDFLSPEDFADSLLEWAETFGGRPNHCTKQFVERRKEGAKFPKCGADDSQANSLIKAVVLAVRYYGLPELNEKVEAAIRVHQNDDKAVEFGLAAAKAVERVILGESVPEVALSADVGATPNVATAVKWVVDEKTTNPMDFYKVVANHLNIEKPVYATSCQLPGSFAVPLQLVYQYPSYEDAIRQNILLGGDNCSRGVFIGALCAGAGSKIPQEWIDKTRDIRLFEKMVDVILSKRTSA